MTILQTKDLKKYYGSGDTQVKALDGVNLDIEEGAFVAIGRVPNTALVAGKVQLDAQGYVAADETTRTSVPGVFAVGDVRTKAVRQIVTAAADGAVAAHFAQEFIEQQA